MGKARTKTISRAWKTELKPNKKQEAQFELYATARNAVYNWAIRGRRLHWQRVRNRRAYAKAHPQRRRWANPGLSWSAQSRELTQRLKALPRDHWLKQPDNMILRRPLKEVDVSYQKWWKERGVGMPEYANPRNRRWNLSGKPLVDISNSHIRLGKIGWVRFKETGYIPSKDAMDFKSATVSRDATGRWFVSVQGEIEMPAKKANGRPIGIDRGVSKLAATSDGRMFEPVKSSEKLETQLALLQRKEERQRKACHQCGCINRPLPKNQSVWKCPTCGRTNSGVSNNRKRTKAAIAKVHKRLRNVRRDMQHKVTSEIVGARRQPKQRPRAVVLESLNIRGMLKNGRMARAISRAGMGELGRQIEYKAGWYGCEVEKADTWYASSKLCSACGEKHEALQLSDREWACPACGAIHERDYNASVNLEKLVAIEPEPQLELWGA
jgi:putative transposase